MHWQIYKWRSFSSKTKMRTATPTQFITKLFKHFLNFFKIKFRPRRLSKKFTHYLYYTRQCLTSGKPLNIINDITYSIIVKGSFCFFDSLILKYNDASRRLHFGYTVFCLHSIVLSYP